MSFLRSWGSKGANPATTELSQRYEIDSLDDALSATRLIMEDKFDEAGTYLRSKSSPFHKFLLGVCYFQRALLGTEPETVKAGLNVLGDAEQLIVEFYNRALQDPASTHSSDIFPSGTVYSLMQAETQFMYALVAIMNASFSDAIRALMKMRKAYATMQHIFKLERDHFEKHNMHSRNEDVSDSTETASRRSFEYQLTEASADIVDLTSHPIDAFIHRGVCYSYGVLMWALSVVPPPFDKVLSFMSYRGDRKLGHTLMWAASNHSEDIHGALAGFSTLVIYNGMTARCTLRTADAVPYDKVDQLLMNLQRLYPASHKWAVQKAVILSVRHRNLEEARRVLLPATEDDNALKFIRARSIFERGCKSLYLHDYDACAAAFVEIAKYTDWSYALFHYVAGISYTAAYRRAVDQHADADTIATYADEAGEALGQVMIYCGKRKILGKPVPIEVYIKGNMSRWYARSNAEGCTLPESVDVAPSEELMWLYGGYEQMAREQLEVSMHNLELYETRSDEELARKSLFKAVCLRNLGQLDDAKSELANHVLCHTAADAKTWDRHASNWVLPAAHYDMAVCLWQEAQSDLTNKTKLQACAEHVQIASKWAGGHDLQTIMSIQIGAAIDALKKPGVEV